MTKKLSVSPLFFVLMLLMFLTGKFLLFISYICALILHEMAHIVEGEKRGYCLKRFRLSVFGATADIDGGYFSYSDQIAISFAGPVCNLLISIIIMALWWVFPALIPFSQLFVFSNLVLAGINLLPALPLDGGRIMYAILTSKYSNNKSTILLKILNIIISVLFFVMFIFIKDKTTNITMLLFSIFILLGVFLKSNASNYFYITLFKKKKNKNYSGIKCVAVPSNIAIYKVYSKMSFNKLNIIYINFPSGKIKQLNEYQLNELCEKYSATTTFDDLINR